MIIRVNGHIASVGHPSVHPHASPIPLRPTFAQTSFTNTLRETALRECRRVLFRNNVEEIRKMRGENWFIAPLAFVDFQLVLVFISRHDLENRKFRMGMVLLDVFRKYATAIPIKSKAPPDILAG